jgi:hypothetical protein
MKSWVSATLQPSLRGLVFLSGLARTLVKPIKRCKMAAGNMTVVWKNGKIMATSLEKT